MGIGEMIEKLRRERHLVQKELAAAMNVSVGTISNYENGVHFPDLPMVHKLADFFGVSTDYLLGRTEFRGDARQLNQKVTQEFTLKDFTDSILELEPQERDSVMAYTRFMKAWREKKQK